MRQVGFDIHAEITNNIVAAIERGASNFQMPWHGAGTMMSPVNASSKRMYRGVNILSLWIASEANGYNSSHWATFKQWQDMGHIVRRGEKGTPIVFYKKLVLASNDAESCEASDERTIPFARASWVFNAAQVEGAALDDRDGPTTPHFDVITNVENTIRATGANIAYGGSRAFYHRLEDRIQIPMAADFIGTPTSTAQESYYSAILHELAHWTGAEHRLNRVKGKRFADRAYAFEEIIAELAAAFACCRLGVTTSPRADHAAYIADYLKILRNDKTAVFTAAAAASAATDYVLGFGKANQDVAA
eukprot:gene6260-6331_t